MAGWLLPALKAVIPHVGDILSAAKPAFTKRKADPATLPAGNALDLLQQQIAELQAVSLQQSSHIKQLAAQLENTVAALEKAAEIADARMRRTLIFTAVAAAVAVAALGVSVIAALAG